MPPAVRRCALLLLLATFASASASASAAPPLVVLYEAWVYLPHSYAIVTSLELLHLLRLYGPAGSASAGRLRVYVREPPYFSPEWEAQRALAFDDEYNSLLLRALPRWSGEKVDVVLRRAFPHDLGAWPGEADGVPLLLFYTSEHGAALRAESFSAGGVAPLTRDAVARRLAAPRLHLLTPSAWSARGAAAFGRNATVLPHGVDARLFRRLPRAARAATRARLGLRPSDFLLLSVGAMTANKGIVPLLAALHTIVTTPGAGGAPNITLMLKGVADLYDSRALLHSHFPAVLRALAAAGAPAAGPEADADLEASCGACARSACNSWTARCRRRN
jgi:glycosyltransferase involved in cell wall biosynthesis